MTAPRKPNGEPKQDAALRPSTRQQRGNRRHKQWRRTVEHAGQRGRHVLFGKREHAERKRQPQHADAGGGRPIGADHRAARAGKQGQRQEPDGDARERHAVGRHGVQAFGDEEERRAPDHARQDQQRPVDGPGALATAARDSSYPQDGAEVMLRTSE